MSARKVLTRAMLVVPVIGACDPSDDDVRAAISGAIKGACAAAMSGSFAARVAEIIEADDACGKGFSQSEEPSETPCRGPGGSALSWECQECSVKEASDCGGSGEFNIEVQVEGSVAGISAKGTAKVAGSASYTCKRKYAEMNPVDGNGADPATEYISQQLDCKGEVTSAKIASFSAGVNSRVVKLGVGMSVGAECGVSAHGLLFIKTETSEELTCGPDDDGSGGSGGYDNSGSGGSGAVDGSGGDSGAGHSNGGEGGEVNNHGGEGGEVNNHGGTAGVGVGGSVNVGGEGNAGTAGVIGVGGDPCGGGGSGALGGGGVGSVFGGGGDGGFGSFYGGGGSGSFYGGGGSGSFHGGGGSGALTGSGGAAGQGGLGGKPCP